DADAVVLLLVDPARRVERFAHQRRQHGLDAARQAGRGHAGFAVERGGSAPAACSSWRALAPAARAMPTMERRETTDFGFSSVRSSVAEACWSRCLISSHWRSRIRTSTHEPFIFLPCRRILMSPLARALFTSALPGGSGVTSKRRLRLYSASRP